MPAEQQQAWLRRKTGRLQRRIIATLQQTGDLTNTYMFFTSDNGFHQGQHRLATRIWGW